MAQTDKVSVFIEHPLKKCRFCESGPVGASGREWPKPKKYRFLFKILGKSIEFESRGRSEQAAGSGRDRKSIVFYLKSFEKVSILRVGASRSRQPGTAETEKVSFFI